MKTICVHRFCARGLIISIAILSLALLAVTFGSVFFVRSAGLDGITVSLSNETTGAAAQVTVGFPVANLSLGETINIYLGESTTNGNEWGQNGLAIGDIACSDDGTDEIYTVNSVTGASPTASLWTQITATAVGSGATTVTCIIGDGSPNPTNPASAGSYSVAIVTTEDSGSGVAFVGNANDITVSVSVLPNLSLLIDGADGSVCTTNGSGITSCNLGIITDAAVKSGSYVVNVGTNAVSGATMLIGEDHDLNNGGDDIGDYTEDSGTVAAGTEEYGIAVTADPSWNLIGNYQDNDSPIPGGPDSVASTIGPISRSGDDVGISHRVAVSSTTKPLMYSHTVSWTASANF